jgi:hypothetical protein
MESRPILNRVPDNTILVKGQGEKGEHIEVFRAEDNSYAMAYIPLGKTFTINTSFIPSNQINAWWFNPKDATAQKAEATREAHITFTTPTTGDGNDWVLIIDEASKGYEKPGK